MNNIKKVVESDKCVGCGCCKAVCPTDSIITIEKNGFYFPEVITEKCVDCGKCESVCTMLDNTLKYNEPLEWYAGYANDGWMPSKSTSGGICSLLSRMYLEKGKNVYAASFDDKWELSHKRIENIQQLIKFDGSKYMQSTISTAIYQDISDKLKNDEECLFIGTPCQVAGIIKFLKTNRVEMNNFFSIDFMCHGVPSPILGRKFFQYLEKKERKKISSYNFRSKSHGWGKMYRAVAYEGEKESVIICNACPLHNWFGKHLSLRPSCFTCKYRRIERISDITVADFWGVNKYYPDIPTKQGVSAVQINSLKGKEQYDLLIKSDRIVSFEVSKESIWDRKTATANFAVPKEYNAFWNNAKIMNMKQLIKEYPPESKMRRNIMRIEGICNKMKKLFK